MAENISPEERLFKAIQEEKKNSSVVKKTGKFIGDQRKSVSRWLLFNKERLPVGTNKAIQTVIRNPFSGIDIKSVNNFFVVLLMLLVLLTGYYVVNVQYSIDALIAKVSNVKINTNDNNIIESLPSLAFYLDLVQKRDIFISSRDVVKEVAPVVAQRDILAELQEKAKTLRVVGISWGERPKVMIKDENTTEVYFLKEGQMIGATEIKVKTIYNDKIVISYEGEEMYLL